VRLLTESDQTRALAWSPLPEYGGSGREVPDRESP
jgi:hypothetical protein